jgi:hypothetical protein
LGVSEFEENRRLAHWRRSVRRFDEMNVLIQSEVEKVITNNK